MIQHHIEKSIVKLKDGFNEIKREKESQEIEAGKEKRKGKIKELIPAIIIAGLVMICVVYFFAAGDWLGKVIGIVAIILILKFGYRKLVNSIKNASAEGRAWDAALSEFTEEVVNQMDEQVSALMYYCTDLDNYMQILRELENEENFIQKYISDPMAGLSSYENNMEDKETFISEFLNGRIERYTYLLS